MGLLFSDVTAEAASRLRLDTAQSNLNTLVNGWGNQVIQDVHSRYDWPWTLDRQIVQTVADKTAGTVSVSIGGTTVTGVSTAFADSDVGSFIQFQDSNDWYKISARASTTSLTIEIAYNGTTALSAKTYTIRKFFYTLSNADKIIDVTQAQTWRKLTPVHFRDYDAGTNFFGNTGKATQYLVYGLDSSLNIRFSIYPHADAAYNLEIKYKIQATESSLTAIPAAYRNVYIDGIMVRGLEYIAIGQTAFDRNLITMKRQEYEGGIKRMMSDAEPEDDYHPVLRSRESPMSLPTPKLPDSLSIPLD